MIDGRRKCHGFQRGNWVSTLGFLESPSGILHVKKYPKTYESEELGKEGERERRSFCVPVVADSQVREKSTRFVNENTRRHRKKD